MKPDKPLQFARTRAGNSLRLLAAAGLAAFLAACAGVPNQEMADARLAVRAAHDAGAERHATSDLEQARHALGAAEQALRAGDYQGAREQAQLAHERASQARELAAAVAGAHEELRSALAAGAAWRDTAGMLERAEGAARAGRQGEALGLALAVRDQARQALRQAEREAELYLARVPAMSAAGRVVVPATAGR